MSGFGSDDATLVDDCDRYLEGLHSVLWGRAFGVHSPKERRQAAEWLAMQVRGVMESRR